MFYFTRKKERKKEILQKKKKKQIRIPSQNYLLKFRSSGKSKKQRGELLTEAQNAMGKDRKFMWNQLLAVH
jgi:hypothetical protein